MDQQIVATVIRRFAARDFLEISGEDDAKLALIDLTHETVIWRWPDLMKWVEAEQEDALRIRFIQAAATNNRKLSGVTLVDARELRNRIKLRPQWIRRYLDTSELKSLLDWIVESAEEADKDYEKEKWNRRLLFGALFLAISLSIFGGWVGWGFYQTKRIAIAQAAVADKRADFSNRQAQLAVAQIKGLQQQLSQAQSDLAALRQQKLQGSVPNPQVSSTPSARAADSTREIDSIRLVQAEQQQQIQNVIILLIMLGGGYAAYRNLSVGREIVRRTDRVFSGGASPLASFTAGGEP